MNIIDVSDIPTRVAWARYVLAADALEERVELLRAMGDEAGARKVQRLADIAIRAARAEVEDPE